jgi:hypothetical protein
LGPHPPRREGEVWAAVRTRSVNDEFDPSVNMWHSLAFLNPSQRNTKVNADAPVGGAPPSRTPMRASRGPHPSPSLDQHCDESPRPARASSLRDAPTCVRVRERECSVSRLTCSCTPFPWRPHKRRERERCNHHPQPPSTHPSTRSSSSSSTHQAPSTRMPLPSYQLGK